MPAVPADVTPAYLAIDWGTTNRQIYVIANDGTMLDTIRDDRGVLAMAAGEYPSEIAAIRDRLGDLPIIAAGMVGSTRGWREAAYVPAPPIWRRWPVPPPGSRNSGSPSSPASRC